MAFSGRLINLRHFFKHKKEAFIPEEEINSLNIGSETFEDEMFIGSIFSSDLSGNQNILVNDQQDENNKNS